MDAEWGPWIEHDGRSHPPIGTVAEAITFGGECLSGIINERAAGGVSGRVSRWIYAEPQDNFVRRYRIRKPKGMTILEQLVKNPERELEDVW